MATRQEVFKALNVERAYQDELWGGCGHDCTRQSEDWISSMLYYLLKAVAGKTKEERMDQVRKVTALGVAAMEYCGIQHRDYPKDTVPEKLEGRRE